MTTLAKLLGRNQPCHCGSGRKYKLCCLDKDEAAARVARAKEAATASPPPATSQEAAPPARPAQRAAGAQPWKRTQNTRGFHKVTTPRKVGGG